MSARLVRTALACYPRAWRDRYGAELAVLTDDLIEAGETSAFAAAANLVGGAVRQRWRAAARSHDAVLTATLAMAVGAVVVAAAIRAGHRGGTMRPYFYTHHVGFVLFVAVVAWLMVEFVEFLRVQERRSKNGSVQRTPTVAFYVVGVAVVIAENVWLYLAPPVVPDATISHGGVAFAVGMTIFLAGVAMRVWSFRALGQYFSFSIEVRPDQNVVTAGPYRTVRHPSYAGGLLMVVGVGLTSANWAAVAVMAVLALVMVVWRIRVEENALLTTLGDRYRSYASGTKRLVPLVW
ncbi:MAG TPA: isoprenylcysteine carboxylmethyltransferase family protein [Micromonosporaceae bacterium]|jgi:protein-S-isoprenylcysteine O-methyltransferase Ste14|nr:isoprenylcysteine carboxylmethyltransferase family protein [Micromonosporaceae bacterium]